MKKYIQLSIFAEGGYSGATYEEYRFITKEIWEKIEDEIDRQFYIYELDGKHSCCECDFEVEEFTEEELIQEETVSSDGNSLKYHLVDVMEKLGNDNAKTILSEIENEVKKLSTLYPYEDVTVKIRKENKEKLMEFVKGLQ